MQDSELLILILFSHKELSKTSLHLASKNMVNVKYTQFYMT